LVQNNEAFCTLINQIMSSQFCS